MNLIETTACQLLKQSKPAQGLQPVTVLQFSTFFYWFLNADVWTADGWMVTAIGGHGHFTLHLRKGAERATVSADGSEMLEYVPNAQTREIASYFVA